jgi:Ca2+-binding RTX toxin-like protein
MATPPFFGPEFVVNTTTTGFQGNPSITGLADGKFVAVWVDTDNIGGFETITAQQYSADGSKFGGEFIVNGNQVSDATEPTVTALEDGRYVVAWTNTSAVDAGDGSGASVKARIFNADGSSAGNEFFINQVTQLEQVDVSISALADGGFAASWTHDFGSNDFDIRGRVFNADGTPRADEFVIDNSLLPEFESSTTGLAGGGFVTVWTDFGGGGETDGSGSHIRAQIFDAAGNKLGIEFVVNSATLGDQFEPTVTALTNGGFAVAWTRDFDDNDTDAIIRIFGANGTPQGSDFFVDGDFNTDEGKVSMTALADGNLFVTWRDAGSAGDTDGSFSHINGSIISGVDGSELSGKFVVNTTTPLEQVNPSVTVLADGRVVVSWTDGSQSSSAAHFDVRAQIIDPRTVAVNLTGTAVADDWVGTGFADIMDGKGGNDILNGGAGSDIMKGGTDNDIYVIDSAGDIVTELAGGGIDTIKSTVSSTLAANVENLTLLGTANLSGTGNGLNNTIVGNFGNNVLNGGLGADKLIGSAGNDKYNVDNAGDVIIEAAGGGTADRVYASVSYQLAAGAEIEILNTASNGGVGAVNLVGNEFIQTIVGNAGNNIINGLGGGDTMSGLGGNDRYHVDDSADVIVEEVGGGTDRVLTSVDYSLKSGVEVELFTTTNAAGTAALKLAGNAFANAIVGNAGNNFLNGAAGLDTLTGLGGNDIFMFNTAIGGGNIDEITDFNVADDTIRLDNAIFANIAGTGVLTAAQFVANASGTAQDANDRIIYETDTGRLIYDANGSAAGGAVQFATLDANLGMINADFFVV